VRFKKRGSSSRPGHGGEGKAEKGGTTAFEFSAEKDFSSPLWGEERKRFLETVRRQHRKGEKTGVITLLMKKEKEHRHMGILLRKKGKATCPSFYKKKKRKCPADTVLFDQGEERNARSEFLPVVLGQGKGKKKKRGAGRQQNK